MKHDAAIKTIISLCFLVDVKSKEKAYNMLILLHNLLGYMLIHLYSFYFAIPFNWDIRFLLLLCKKIEFLMELKTRDSVMEGKIRDLLQKWKKILAWSVWLAQNMCWVLAIWNVMINQYKMMRQWELDSLTILQFCLWASQMKKYGMSLRFKTMWCKYLIKEKMCSIKLVFEEFVCILLWMSVEL